MTLPTNKFIGQNNPIPRHPAPTRPVPRGTEGASDSPPPLPPDTRITVRNMPARGRIKAHARVTLNRGVLAAIPKLLPEAPVDVVVPSKRGGTWFLDLRPTAVRRLPPSSEREGFARFHIAAVSTEHLLVPGGRFGKGEFGGAAGTTASLGERTFHLGPEIVEDYFALIPVKR